MFEAFRISEAVGGTVQIANSIHFTMYKHIVPQMRGYIHEKCSLQFTPDETVICVIVIQYECFFLLFVW